MYEIEVEFTDCSGTFIRIVDSESLADRFREYCEGRGDVLSFTKRKIRPTGTDLFSLKQDLRAWKELVR